MYNAYPWNPKVSSYANPNVINMEGMLKLDEKSSTFLKFQGGKWVPLPISIEKEKVYKRSMSKMIEPDSESAGNIGFDNETNGFSSISMGKMARTYLRGQEAFSSGGFLKRGDSQTTRFIIKGDVKPEDEKELLIDDQENYVLPSKKASVYFSIKFFIRTKSKKHYVLKYKAILTYQGDNVCIEELEKSKFPEKWSFEMKADDREIYLVAKAPVDSRWVGICKTIEIVG